jgi:hypothetical protein
MIQKQKIVAKYHQFFLHFSFLTASKIVLSVAPDGKRASAMMQK